jgi:mRNA-degrading endonuclease RelE of RelBE toxin-antitoxin system
VTSQRYALESAPKAVRSLGKLDRQIAERIRAAAEALRDDPRPAGARMLTGMHGVWRIRVPKTTGSCTRLMTAGCWSWL